MSIVDVTNNVRKSQAEGLRMMSLEKMAAEITRQGGRMTTTRLHTQVKSGEFDFYKMYFLAHEGTGWVKEWAELVLSHLEDPRAELEKVKGE